MVKLLFLKVGVGGQAGTYYLRSWLVPLEKFYLFVDELENPIDRLVKHGLELISASPSIIVPSTKGVKKSLPTEKAPPSLLNQQVGQELPFLRPG